MQETQPSPSQTKDEYRLLGEDISNTEDAFGHSEIVEALKGAILAARPPFSIGLVGEWGVGKSFVLRRLEKGLRGEAERERNIEVFYFDAWKYAGESVKRSLLERLFHEKQLSDTDLGKEWLTRLYHTQQKPSRVVISTSWKTALFKVIFAFVVGLSVYGIVKWAGYPLIALAPGALATFLILALTIFNNVIQVAWESVSVPPIASAEKFEEIFEDFLKEVLGDDKNKRVVILIDELDRCDAKTRAEVLQGLRTYLQNERCVYAVACAPKSLLQGSSDPSLELPDEEFLRKLFNLTCWIDPQGEENLRKYADRCLEEAGFKDDNRDLVQIVVLGNTKNPRRIKHFLNTLSFALRVARAREKSGRIQNEAVTHNKAFLAKVLILRQDWPEEFSEIVREPRKLSQWTKPDSPDEIKSDLRQFLYSTDQYMVDDPRPFFAITMGVAPSGLQPNAGLIDSIFKRDIEMAKSIVESQRPEDYHSWSDLLFQELRECRRLRTDQFFINGLIVVCALLEYVPEDKQKEYIEYVCDFMEPDHIRKALRDETADIVFPLALRARPEMTLKLLKYYLSNFFKEGEINEAIGETLERHAKEIPQEIKDALNVNTIETWRQIQQPGDLRLLTAFEEWPQNEGNVAYLVTPDTIRVLINAFREPLNLRYEEKLYEVAYRLGPAWDRSISEWMTERLFKKFPDEEPTSEKEPQGVLTNEQLLSIRWIEKLFDHECLSIEPEKALRLFWKSFKNLKPSGEENSTHKVYRMVKVCLRFNPPPQAEVMPDLTAILDHFIGEFKDQLGLFGSFIPMDEPRSYAAEDILVDFAVRGFIEEKYDHSFAPHFINMLVSMGRSPEAGQCIYHILQSDDANMVLDETLTECAKQARNHSYTDLLRTIIKQVDELGQTARFAYCAKFLDAVSDWCLELGISNDPRAVDFGRFLFGQTFQFMPDSARKSFADNYMNAFIKSAAKLTEIHLDFILLIKDIWNYLSQPSQVLVLMGLGQLARPDAHDNVRYAVKRILQEFFTPPGIAAQDTEQLALFMEALISRSASSSTFSDRAAYLRAAAMIVAGTNKNGRKLEDEIEKLETSFDDDFRRLAEELRELSLP